MTKRLNKDSSHMSRIGKRSYSRVKVRGRTNNQEWDKRRKKEQEHRNKLNEIKDKIEINKVIEIIEEWFSGLGYTQGIVVRMEKCCSNYDLSELLEQIKNPNYKKIKEDVVSKYLYGKNNNEK